MWTVLPSTNQSWWQPRECGPEASKNEIERGGLQAELGHLVGDRHQVARDLERIGAHLRVRQVGLHHHLGRAWIADVDRREIPGRAFVREPEDPGALPGELHRHADRKSVV